jgi:hypothetical protein
MPGSDPGIHDIGNVDVIQPAAPLGDYRGWFYGDGSKIKVKGVIQDYTPVIEDYTPPRGVSVLL